MSPELNKVSNCCGDRLLTINDPEGTAHYECFACKKPCDGVQDCADCFPQHYPFSKGKTVPLCDKHYKEAIQKQPPEETNSICEKHCWSRKTDPIADHSDCDNCCVCKISYIEATKIKDECHCSRTSRYHTQDSYYQYHTPQKCWSDKKDNDKYTANIEHKSDKEIPRTDDSYATLIGGIILNVGNIYNENKQDITVRVAEYIYKNYIK